MFTKKLCIYSKILKIEIMSFPAVYIYIFFSLDVQKSHLTSNVVDMHIFLFWGRGAGTKTLI